MNRKVQMQKKFFLWSTILVSTLFCLSATVFLFPNILVNKTTLGWVLNTSTDNFSSTKFEFSLKNKGLFDRELRLLFKNMNISFLGIKIEVDELDFKSILHTNPQNLLLKEIENLTVNSMTIRLPERRNSEESSKNEFVYDPDTLQSIFAPVENIKLGSISLTEIKIYPEPSSALEISTFEHNSLSDTDLSRGEINFIRNQKKEFTLKTRFQPVENDESSRVQLGLSTNNIEINLDSLHHLNGGNLGGKFDINLEGFHKYFKKDNLITCNYQTNVQSTESLPQLNIACKWNQHLNLETEISLKDRLKNSEFSTKVKLTDPVKFVKNLEQDFEIPAPFNVLKGEISCNLMIRHINNFSSKLPLSCKTELDDGEQVTLNTSIDSNTILDENYSPKSFEVYFRLIQSSFVLPNIDLLSPNIGLGGDNRIILDEQNAPVPAKADLKIDISAKAKTVKPLLLISNLLEEPLPIILDLELKGSKLSGKVAIKNHGLKLLKRRLTIDSLEVLLDPTKEDPDLMGKIQFDSNVYNIELNVAGTVKQPVFYFSSNPVMSDNEIIAYLLFGQHPEYLEQNDLKSVSNTQAALANGAVSLISMYYLASTPVESVGFDPSNNYLSARISPAEGVTVSVGTIQDSQNDITIRKYLGNGWSVETKYLQSVRQNSGKAVGLLRWGRRY